MRAGLDDARSGAAAISSGLRQALDGATALKRGSAEALTGSQALAGGLGSASKPVKAGLPVFQGLASDVAAASSAVTAAHGAAQSASGQVAGALDALKAMDAGKADPGYGAALNALAAAQTAASGVESALAGVQPKLAGAAALESGLGQLTNGAGQLQTGLSSGVGPAGQLAGGLDQLQAGVTKFRGSLPSTKDIERLQRESPGLFDSGYFVLAAIAGAKSADRALASFAVNLDRGGNAGQIVVVPRAPARSEATRELGSDLRDSAAAFAKSTGTQVAVGGPAGDLADFTSETNERLPLVVIALALGVALVLMIALQAIALPLVAVACDLLTAAATFGAMALLFGGQDPLLGGPGYLDPMSIIGIFAAIFGLSITYEVLLLTRTREAFVISGDARESLAFGLRGTAAVATGAAAVMIAAALPFAFSELGNVRQFGVGIAIAVALDAVIVRPVLLPAAVAVLGRRSWWPTGRPAHSPSGTGQPSAGRGTTSSGHAAV